MKKVYYLALCFVILGFSNTTGQTSYSESDGFEGKNLKSVHADANWFKMMYSDNPNIFKIQQAYDEYFQTNPFVKIK